MIKNAKYIVCDSNKTPQHAFDKWKQLSEVKDEDNLGIILEEPYLIVDIDDETEFDIVCKIIKRLNVKTKILKTNRGGHFWFKSTLPLKNVVHSNTPLSVTVDIKCWGKKTMEMVKRNGEWREWLQEDDDVDELPLFLKPAPLTKHYYGMDDGDGRNDALFTSIIPLIRLGYNKDSMKELFYLINEYMFASPLKYDEIDAMLDKNDVFKSKTYQFYNGSAFQHDVFADFMIEKYHIKYYHGDIYIYDGRIYVSDEKLIKAKMIEVLPNLKKNNTAEVLESIQLKVLQHETMVDRTYINVENGLLNVVENSIIPHTPDIFTVNKIPVKYNPAATSVAVDNMLNNVCCGRQNLVNLLMQMIGYILVPTCKYQKAFILLGNGSNGKSLVLETIRSLFGDDNCSSLALEDLGDRFRPSEIVSAMVNIGDDSGHGLLENTAIFKKLVTGDSMTFERKHGQPFKHANTAKMIFAANALPPTTDKSDGFFRRCIIIPFEAVFRPGDANYDPAIIYKVTSDEAKSHLLNLALEGLAKLNQNQYFDEADESRTLVNQYEVNNNSVLAWVTEKPKIYGSVAEAYTAYVAYCTMSNYKPCNIGRFKIEFEKYKKRPA